jgi:hypothetical protein
LVGWRDEDIAPHVLDDVPRLHELASMTPSGARAELDLARASGQLDELRANVGGDLDRCRSSKHPSRWITDAACQRRARSRSIVAIWMGSPVKPKNRSGGTSTNT